MNWERERETHSVSSAWADPSQCILRRGGTYGFVCEHGRAANLNPRGVTETRRRGWRRRAIEDGNRRPGCEVYGSERRTFGFTGLDTQWAEEAEKVRKSRVPQPLYDWGLLEDLKYFQGPVWAWGYFLCRYQANQNKELVHHLLTVCNRHILFLFNKKTSGRHYF